MARTLSEGAAGGDPLRPAARTDEAGEPAEGAAGESPRRFRAENVAGLTVSRESAPILPPRATATGVGLTRGIPPRSGGLAGGCHAPTPKPLPRARQPPPPGRLRPPVRNRRAARPRPGAREPGRSIHRREGPGRPRGGGGRASPQPPGRSAPRPAEPGLRRPLRPHAGGLRPSRGRRARGPARDRLVPAAPRLPRAHLRARPAVPAPHRGGARGARHAPRAGARPGDRERLRPLRPLPPPRLGALAVRAPHGPPLRPGAGLVERRPPRRPRGDPRRPRPPRGAPRGVPGRLAAGARRLQRRRSEGETRRRAERARRTTHGLLRAPAPARDPLLRAEAARDLAPGGRARGLRRRAPGDPGRALLRAGRHRLPGRPRPRRRPGRDPARGAARAEPRVQALRDRARRAPSAARARPGPGELRARG